MIVQDTENLLNYISQIKNRVNNLTKDINVDMLPDMYKKKILDAKLKIYAGLSLIEARAEKNILIPKDYLEKQKQKIDVFYKDLSDATAQAATYLKQQEKIR